MKTTKHELEPFTHCSKCDNLVFLARRDAPCFVVKLIGGLYFLLKSRMPYLSPNNAFISNPHYYENSSSKFIYKQSVLYYIQKTNDTLSLIIGIPLSMLVFYLIATRSPLHFRPYRKMLVLGTAIDTLLLVQMFLLQAVSFLGFVIISNS